MSDVGFGNGVPTIWTNMLRWILMFRHILPVPAMRILGRLLRWSMNRRLLANGYPPCNFAFCHPTVQIRGSGKLRLAGGYLLSAQVELDLTTRGQSSSSCHITLGHNISLQRGVLLHVGGGFIWIGSTVHIGPYSVFYGQRGITIGKDVLFGPQCLVAAVNHGIAQGSLFREQPESGRGIVIGDNVWVGGHATILDGVTIGPGSVIAAGAVVTRSVPPGVLVAGVLARIVREIG